MMRVKISFKVGALVAVLGAIAWVGTGCTVNGNIVGSSALATVGSLPTWGSPLAPDNNDSFGPPPGSPHGGPNNLVVELVYIDPPAYNEAGHSIYYIGTTMPFEVRLYNYGVSAFPQLDISVEQQYYNDGPCGNHFWMNYTSDAAVETKAEGDALAGSSASSWSGVTLPAQHMIVLTSGYAIPYNVCPGLSQTALKIEDDHGNLIYYNPEAGVWDPPVKP